MTDEEKTREIQHKIGKAAGVLKLFKLYVEAVVHETEVYKVEALDEEDAKRRHRAGESEYIEALYVDDTLTTDNILEIEEVGK